MTSLPSQATFRYREPCTPRFFETVEVDKRVSGHEVPAAERGNNLSSTDMNMRTPPFHLDQTAL